MSPEVARAVEVLRAGGLVAFPTETVYGLGADASNGAAVRRIFDVKGRPVDHPLIVHLAAGSSLDGWAAVVSGDVRILTSACWPGPLTVLAPRGPKVALAVTGGRDTVGLRVPAHPMALELLGAFGGGLAAPSANRFGRVSPTTADHVRRDLGADVDLVLDGGPCAVGVESTIVDCTVEPPMVLRHGGIPVDELERLLGRPVARVAEGPSRASGMLESHYAPRCRVVLCEDADEALLHRRLVEDGGLAVDVLDAGADVEAYARHLYAWLREADERGLDVLVAVLPPPQGLGAAVRDRLAKAAAPRP